MRRQKKTKHSLIKHLTKIWGQWRVLAIILFSSLLLSGCVDYDVGINFETQNQGEIVQHIQLGQQLTSFSGSPIDEWLNSIKRRARQLGGNTQRLSDRELLVKIPFYNGAELEQKFNQFFNPVENQKAQPDSLTSDLPEIKSHLKITQNNFLLAIRNKFTYDLDLSSLGVITSNGNILVSPGSILDLDFSLSTPWGVQKLETSADSLPPQQQNNQINWEIKPGQLNHLETVFWVPSPIGIGAVAIIIIVAAGGFLKYQIFPAIGIGKRKATT